MLSQLAQVITFYIPTVVWRHTKTIICFAYVVNNILASLRTVIIFKIQAIAPPFCFFLGYLFSLALVIGRGKGTVVTWHSRKRREVPQSNNNEESM